MAIRSACLIMNSNLWNKDKGLTKDNISRDSSCCLLMCETYQVVGIAFLLDFMPGSGAIRNAMIKGNSGCLKEMKSFI
ncbi:hypothetical protein JOD18_003640 [Gracilibacillus alcaliphilus]|nr:hypothetical protein [Gracilibacillus alcaliphilus]